MALAIQQQVSDGTLTYVDVGIPFFNQSDIAVYFNQESKPLDAGIAYEWESATRITFKSGYTPVASGVLVRLVRTTQIGYMYNIYDGNAPFTRLTLDENFKQLLYRAQEYSEGLGFSGIQQALNMNGYRITGLGDAVEDTDAANLGQVKDAVNNEATLRIAADNAEAQARADADAELLNQLLGITPTTGSQFSVISWHPQVVSTSVSIPENMNAWSFGPTITIADGQVVTVGEGSYYTIADGATTQEGPLTAELPSPVDFGEL